MADGDKPDVSAASVLPTAPGKVGDAEAPLGTMQLPRGAIGAPPAMPGGAPTPQAAPLMATVMPNTAAPMPSVAPPAMPSDWRYSITVEIARGGMGRVVEATDTVLGRSVALKEALSVDPESVRRFQRETRITARLEHPAIVPVHDAGFTPNGSPFYVMRKIGGRPLEELVARSDTLAARLALVPHIVASAHAIAHAHARGIVHRDIKPSNILAGDLGETIVIDWGLAKAIGEPDDANAPVQRIIEDDDSLKTRAGIVFGTPGFMAPEQLRGSPVDEKCDVYALGATLYHLLARRPPHYSKNGDEMMRAAVAGPPTPLTAIVEGVPPELATIVDKALAFDATVRYQNAGALAEDLQRFLTGQLVASHYYTPRERVLRFLRKYRAAVGVSAFALVALAVVALVLVQRIRNERDRADEQARIALTEKNTADIERERAIQGARELLWSNARQFAMTDPTRAVGLVKPLGKSDAWRQARDVGAAARAHGVAFSLPASPKTLTLELSRDGQRALAAGNDGIVRIYDLAKREAKVIADTKGAVLARFADGERTIVLFQGNRLSLVDAASGDKRDITTPTPIAKLEVSGPIAYWVDPANAVWKLDLANGTPMRVQVGEPVSSVAPSPDGRWIALGGTQHLLLVDRTQPQLPPEIVVEGATKDMTWSADSEDLIAMVDDEIVHAKPGTSPPIFNRMLVGNRFSVAFSAGRIFSTGPNGVAQMSRDGQRVRAPGPEHTLGVFEGRDRVVISAKPQGAIVVLSDYGDHQLACPLPINTVAASARGPWVVAAAAERLLVWNLDAIEPRVVTKRAPSSAHWLTGDHVLVTYEGEPAEWIDLRTNKVTQLGELQAIAQIASSPDGALAVAIDGQRKAHLVAGAGLPQELQGEVSAAAFVDDNRLVLARENGLQIEDQRAHTKLALFAHAAPARVVVATAADGGWVAAAFEDGLVVRKHLASNAATKLQLPRESAAQLAIADDGTVALGVGSELRAWRPDGKVDVLIEDIKPIVQVVLAGPTTAFAVTDEGQAYAASWTQRGPLAQPIGVPRTASFARDASLIAAASPIGAVEVIDPLTQWRWPLATPAKGQEPYGLVELAPDGSRVLAMTGASLLVWTLQLPASADETATWLDKLTNATADSPTGPLGWR